MRFTLLTSFFLRGLSTLLIVWGLVFYPRLSCVIHFRFPRSRNRLRRENRLTRRSPRVLMAQGLPSMAPVLARQPAASRRAIAISCVPVPRLNCPGQLHGRSAPAPLLSRLARCPSRRCRHRLSCHPAGRWQAWRRRRLRAPKSARRRSRHRMSITLPDNRGRYSHTTPWTCRLICRQSHMQEMARWCIPALGCQGRQAHLRWSIDTNGTRTGLAQLCL